MSRMLVLFLELLFHRAQPTLRRFFFFDMIPSWIQLLVVDPDQNGLSPEDREMSVDKQVYMSNYSLKIV